MGDTSTEEFAFAFINDQGKVYLKIRPRSMQFDRTRGKFDYCKAEFSDEVAEEIQPFMEDEKSFLRQPLPVLVIIDGQAVYRLLWVPDGVTFTEDELHIEFHDPQKYLTRGRVDWREDNVKLRDAYEHVFAQRDTSGANILNGIKFTVPETAYDELISTEEEDTLIDPFLGGITDDKLYELTKEPNSAGVTQEHIREIEKNNVYNVIEGHYAVDFDKIPPWEAITRLNEKFGVTTWTTADGTLWVGSRNATGKNHVATPDDSRVWKLSDYNVPEPRDPVIRSVVRGGWADDPSESHAENIFTELESLNIGTKEFRIEGVATTSTDKLFGQEIAVEIDAKKDSLEEIAKRKMLNKQRQQQNGYVDIDPDFSGNEISNIKYVSIGDSILTIPPAGDSDEDSICSTNIELEIFDVVGVQHNVEGGNWSVRLDVVKQLDGELHPSNIDTRLRYYDPSAKEFIEKDELDTDLTFWPKEWFEDVKTTDDYPEIYD